MNKALARARSGGAKGAARGGVVWHTQGSGKSLTMAFYAGRVILEPAMQNPTLVVLTGEGVRAKLRVMVRRILRKHGYPPDMQEKATATVLNQAELLCADWAG